MRFMCQPYGEDDTLTYVWSGGHTVNVYADATDAERHAHCLDTITLEEGTMKAYHQAMVDRMANSLHYD